MIKKYRAVQHMCIFLYAIGGRETWIGGGGCGWGLDCRAALAMTRALGSSSRGRRPWRSRFGVAHGLLRCARNDGVKAVAMTGAPGCHREAGGCGGPGFGVGHGLLRCARNDGVKAVAMTGGAGLSSRGWRLWRSSFW